MLGFDSPVLWANNTTWGIARTSLLSQLYSGSSLSPNHTKRRRRSFEYLGAGAARHVPRKFILNNQLHSSANPFQQSQVGNDFTAHRYSQKWAFQTRRPPSDFPGFSWNTMFLRTLPDKGFYSFYWSLPVKLVLIPVTGSFATTGSGTFFSPVTKRPIMTSQTIYEF